MDTLERRIMAVIKQRVSALGLTQADLARDLGVSLITVKRWYAGKGLRISNLEALAHLLGLKISEILAVADSSGVKTFSYTIAQEEILAADPKLLALFDLLIGGVPLKQIKKKYEMDEKLLTSLLLKLDKMGLIELHANNKIKLVQMGEPLWNESGPLSKKFRAQMIQEFLGNHEKKTTSFMIHDYFPEDAESIKNKIKELESFMMSANKKASFHTKESKSFGSYFSFKEYEWDLRGVLKK
jgi:transcriptional regulator with XRE-family HTH domain